MQIDYQLKIVLILTVGFSLASLFGYLAQRLHFSPILGFLFGGYLIGPFSPGFVADLHLSEQLAEIGVILMLFGVGLHFKWQDLMKVKQIALPGALLQTAVAAICGTAAVYSLGWPLESGIIIGVSIGVASTVVMVRVLNDYKLLQTTEGHIAIGWLVVEDIMTVAFLILIPTFKEAFQIGHVSILTVLSSVGFVLLKFALLALFMFTIGRWFALLVLTHVARLRSNELFTLTILSLIFLIATSSALIFGTSIALGAFIAGMIIGQTVMRHQASANALPLKDAFAVIFFLTIGMLFNPQAILDYWLLFLSILFIILILKPLVAFILMRVYGYPLFMALTVGIALAQIGEFSFILAEQTSKLNLLPNDGYDLIIACALISIALNPLMFKLLNYCKTKQLLDPQAAPLDTFSVSSKPERQAIVVGYGAVGKAVISALEAEGYQTIVIDINVDTISNLTEQKKRAVYGNASHPSILQSAHLDQAHLLVITLPYLDTTLEVISLSRQFNPKIEILARAQYLSDQEILTHLKVKVICNEKETAYAFSQAVTRIIEVN